VDLTRHSDCLSLGAGLPTRLLLSGISQMPGPGVARPTRPIPWSHESA